MLCSYDIIVGEILRQAFVFRTYDILFHENINLKHFIGELYNQSYHKLLLLY